MTIGKVAQTLMAQGSPKISEQTNKTPVKSEHCVSNPTNGHSAVKEGHAGHQQNKAVKEEKSRQTKKTFGDWLSPNKTTKTDNSQHAASESSVQAKENAQPEVVTNLSKLPQLSEVQIEEKPSLEDKAKEEKPAAGTKPASDQTTQVQKSSANDIGILNMPAMAQHDFVALAQTRASLSQKQETKSVGMASDLTALLPKTGAQEPSKTEGNVPLASDPVVSDATRSVKDAMPFLKKLDLSSVKEPIASESTHPSAQLSSTLLHAMPYKEMSTVSGLNVQNRVASTQTALNFKQLTQALNQRIESYRLHGVDTSVIRLDPQHLGSIQIQLKHEGGQLIVQIVSERQDVANRLSDNANLLKNDLLKQDYQNVTVKVHCSGSQGTASWQGQQSNDQSRQEQKQQKQQVGMALSQTSHQGTNASFLQEMK